jgi:hypothetical protein
LAPRPPPRRSPGTEQLRILKTLRSRRPRPSLRPETASGRISRNHFALRRESSAAMQYAPHRSPSRYDFPSSSACGWHSLEIARSQSVLYSNSCVSGTRCHSRRGARDSTKQLPPAIPPLCQVLTVRQGGIIRYQPTSASAAAWLGFISGPSSRHRPLGLRPDDYPDLSSSNSEIAAHTA